MPTMYWCVVIQSQDSWVARHTFITLRHAAPHLVPTHTPVFHSTPSAVTTSSISSIPADPVPPEVHHAMLAAAVRVLVGPPAPSMAPNWPSAAEAAVGAVYVLSPQPQEVMAAVLQEMFRRCRPGGSGGRQLHAGDPAAVSIPFGVTAYTSFATLEKNAEK